MPSGLFIGDEDIQDKQAGVMEAMQRSINKKTIGIERQDGYAYVSQ